MCVFVGAQESISVLRDSGDTESMQLAETAVAGFQKAAGSYKIKDSTPEIPVLLEHTIEVQPR